MPAPGERLISYDKDHWRGDLAFLKKPVLVVLGASHEELRFIRDILHSAGTLTCHGALFHPSRIEFAGDAERFAGYGTGDIALRNHNRQNFLFDIIRDSKPGVAGFLLPRTMDENIRDRVLWTEWFRVLIVRGNVMRAYQEQRQRQHQLKASQHLAVEQQAQMMSENAAIDADELIVETQADEGPMRSEEAGAPPAEETEAFVKFQTDYESYHAEVWKNCSDAKFKFREIDLMDESWPDALTDFMAQSLPVSPEYVHQLQQRRETLVLRAQELSNPYARIRGARWLVRNHVDQRRRQAHIATLNRMAMGRLSRLSRPTLAVFGASDEELRFIQSLLNATGVFACHGALLHPQLFETEKSAKAAAGRRKPELRVRSRKLTGLLADALSGPEHGVPGILLPWNMDQDMGSRLIRLEPIRALVVRGNLLRAFVDQQRRDRVGSPASTTAALEPADPIWVAPKQFERFRSDYEKYHSDLWDDCKSAGSLLFREIDLMNETWLENLIDFIEYAMPLPGGRRIRDRLTRELAVQHVGTLSDPFARITNANWLVSNLIPAKHKEAYALALARSVAVRAEVAGRELEPWPAASPAAAPAGHGEEPPLQRMAGE